MRKLFLSIATAALLASTPVAFADSPPGLDDGVYRSGDQVKLDTVQLYIYGGRHFCWYDDAWSGPGWYWCGYAWHRGYGWGGGYGWHGWGGHGGWHGGHGGWHGGHGGWHGGHGGHGGHHGH